MKGFGDVLRRWALRVIGFFPVPLPVGASQWDKFCKWVLYAYRFPDYPSYRNALAGMIMHFPQTTTRVRPRLLARMIYNGQAKQTAYQVIEDERAKDKARQEKILKDLDANNGKETKPAQDAGNVTPAAATAN